MSDVLNVTDIIRLELNRYHIYIYIHIHTHTLSLSDWWNKVPLQCNINFNFRFQFSFLQLALSIATESPQQIPWWYRRCTKCNSWGSRLLKTHSDDNTAHHYRIIKFWLILNICWEFKKMAWLMSRGFDTTFIYTWTCQFHSHLHSDCVNRCSFISRVYMSVC